MLTTLACLVSLGFSPTAAWSVNPNNTLLWEGAPYMPIGVRVEGSADSVKSAIDAGVTDLIVELPANGAGWDEALKLLNGADVRWFLAVSSTAPAALGTVVEPQGFRLDIEGKYAADLKFPGAEQVLTVIADKRTAVVRNHKTCATPGGQYVETLDSEVLSPHVALFYPVVRDLQTPDFWEGFDGHRDALLQTLKTKDLGTGFRGIIDPMGSVARFPTPDIRFVPRSPIFAIEMESFLKEKYGAVETCVRAWSIGAHDIMSFEQLARLVPLWSDTKGVSSLWDPVTDRVYPSDRENSTVWTDVRTVLRSAAVRRYARLVQAIRAIVDVPVIQTWGGWTGPYDTPQTGVAGVGCSFVASSISDVIESASRPASSVLQGSQSQVLMITGLEIAKDVRLDLETAFRELRAMGARGCFFRADDPVRMSEIASLANRHGGDNGDSGWKPRALFYPEGARNPALPVKIFGGTWQLPSPAPGNRLEFGSSLKGFYYGGLPRPYTVIWSTAGPIKTKLFLADPKAVAVEALDGTEVRIRVRNDSIELEITETPLIFTGIQDIPVPEASYEEMVLLMSALFGNFGMMVDPGGDQEFLFAQNTSAFKRNPIGGYAALVRQFNTLVPRAAPYMWIEAEKSPETNFGEARFVPGASNGDCLVLESRLSTSKGYYARFPLTPRQQVEHEFWIAADIPPALRDSVTLTVGGNVLKITEAPIQYYGLGLAWYKLGSAKMTEQTEVRLQVSREISEPIKVDVLVASPGPFRPDGPRMPLDFIGPG